MKRYVHLTDVFLEIPCMGLYSEPIVIVIHIQHYSIIPHKRIYTILFVSLVNNLDC
jgi:hypothetical protein